MVFAVQARRTTKSEVSLPELVMPPYVAGAKRRRTGHGGALGTAAGDQFADRC